MLLEVDNLEQAERLYSDLRTRKDHGELDDVIELVPAARTVLMVTREGSGRLADLVRGVRAWRPDQSTPSAGPLREIPVRYDGEDLAAVAELTHLTVDEVVRQHSGAALRVAFCGFSPGFAYLVGMPQTLHVPRRSSPRTLVPTGSVGIGGEFTAIYPRPSPGGWQLIGHTSTSLWDQARTPPALLAPGDRVRFVPCAF